MNKKVCRLNRKPRPIGSSILLVSSAGLPIFSHNHVLLRLTEVVILRIVVLILLYRQQKREAEKPSSPGGCNGRCCSRASSGHGIASVGITLPSKTAVCSLLDKFVLETCANRKIDSCCPQWIGCCIRAGRQGNGR